jgi:hypothetical protein
MRYFMSQLGLGFARAQQLAGARRRLYIVLSWLMVALGCIMVVALMLKTRALLGLPMGRTSMAGLHLQFIGWIVVTLVSIPVLFYAGMVVVGSAFAALMLALRGFSPSEAKAFAMFAQPPERWVKSAA